MSRRKKSGNGRISVHTTGMIEDILYESEDHESRKVRIQTISKESLRVIISLNSISIIQGP